MKFYRDKPYKGAPHREIVYVPFHRVGIAQSFMYDDMVFRKIENLQLAGTLVKINAERLTPAKTEEMKSRFHYFDPETSVYDVNYVVLAHAGRIKQ